MVNDQPWRSSTPEPTRREPNGTDGREIAALISRLLSHYWTGDDPEASRRAQIEDWIGDLIEFGPYVVSGACGEWRRGQTRRPTIADLRLICVREQQERRRPDGVALPPPDRERLSDARQLDMRASNARYEAARRQREAFAADLGYPSWKYMMEIGLVKAVREAPNYVNGSRRKEARNVAAEMGVTAREIVPERDEAAREEPPH